LKKVKAGDDGGFYAFSALPQHVLLVGLSSKVSRFRKRWCWVRGPRIAFNLEWRELRTCVEVDRFDIKIALNAILPVRINDGWQWNVKQLIGPELLRDVGLVAAPAVVSSPSLQDSQRSYNPSDPHPYDSSSPSGSEECSDDSFLDSLPPRQHHSTPIPVFPSGKANSSLPNPLCPTVGIGCRGIYIGGGSNKW
ncbi:hypothetical protein Dimus_001645, partial [Dionaea muscipula]